MSLRVFQKPDQVLNALPGKGVSKRLQTRPMSWFVWSLELAHFTRGSCSQVHTYPADGTPRRPKVNWVNPGGAPWRWRSCSVQLRLAGRTYGG